MINYGSFLDELSKIAEEEKGRSVSSRAGYLAKPTEKQVAIYEKLKKLSPVKVSIHDDANLHGGGFYDLLAKEIGVHAKDYETLAHEIGHAIVDQHAVGKFLQHPISRLLFTHGLAPAGIIAGGLAAKDKLWGLAIPAALAAPTIISEALATHEGKKKLEELGLTKEQVEKYKEENAKGFKTYLESPALSYGAAALTYLLAKSSPPK